MSEEKMYLRNWWRIGIVCGFLASFIYPALIFVPFPALISLTLVMLFGPLLSLASTGLYYYLSLHKKKVSTVIALVSNIIAGVLVTAMLLVQFAIRSSRPEVLPDSDRWIWNSLNHVHYGLDVTWDVYIFAGTFFFAISMHDHRRFGRLFSISGVLISILMIVVNAVVFPDPPADGGLFDVGPLIGLWYLAVTIRFLSIYRGEVQKWLA